MINKQNEPLISEVGLSFPPLYTENVNYGPDHCSPYVMSENQFSQKFADSKEKREMWILFCALLRDLREGGFQPVMALLGGSFLVSERPRDLDGVAFYKPIQICDYALVNKFSAAAKTKPLDVSLRPIDCDHVILAKVLIYFHTQFSRDRSSTDNCRGSISVSLE